MSPKIPQIYKVLSYKNVSQFSNFSRSFLTCVVWVNLTLLLIFAQSEWTTLDWTTSLLWVGRYWHLWHCEYFSIMLLPESRVDILDPPSVPSAPRTTTSSWHSLLGHWDSGWDLLPYKGLDSFLSGISQVEITFHNVFLLLFSDVLSWLPVMHVNIRTPGAELAPRLTSLPTSLLRISLQWKFLECGLFGNTRDNLGGKEVSTFPIRTR